MNLPLDITRRNTTADKLVAGFNHVMILVKSKKLFGYGSNKHGQLTGAKSIKVVSREVIKISDGPVANVWAFANNTIIKYETGEIDVLGENKLAFTVPGDISDILGNYVYFKIFKFLI